MRVSNIVVSLSSVTLASALNLPLLPNLIGSVTTTSIPVASATSTATPISSGAKALLEKLAAVDTAIATIKNSISNFQPQNGAVVDVVEIAKSFGSNSILNLAINNALLQTQSLNVKLSSDESKRVTDFLNNNIAQHYKEALALLMAKKNDLETASLKDSGLLNTLLGGNSLLDTISKGLGLGLANQETLNTALINILDPAYQTVGLAVANLIQSLFDGSLRLTVL
ncbi:uncharacterized protein ColSpa_10336 [Colletotrichum spaethianum]|uniref:Cell wall protein n=1 Tax=Colletotrichum spaethianum TaxID=700344 RepID=A0AA37PDJ7_9PEZI|nr:uncharacterized protein ColSpa_10336 [Colletotrichum spaethianum]GKT50155.1 hypothetical protein ColSpa_10336 [Colletotrichum spaethianum]